MWRRERSLTQYKQNKNPCVPPSRLSTHRFECLILHSSPAPIFSQLIASSSPLPALCSFIDLPHRRTRPFPVIPHTAALSQLSLPSLAPSFVCAPFYIPAATYTHLPPKPFSVMHLTSHLVVVVDYFYSIHRPPTPLLFLSSLLITPLSPPSLPSNNSPKGC